MAFSSRRFFAGFLLKTWTQPPLPQLTKTKPLSASRCVISGSSFSMTCPSSA